jgi:hypothetical protein
MVSVNFKKHWGTFHSHTVNPFNNIYGTIFFAIKKWYIFLKSRLYINLCFQGKDPSFCKEKSQPPRSSCLRRSTRKTAAPSRFGNCKPVCHSDLKEVLAPVCHSDLKEVLAPPWRRLRDGVFVMASPWWRHSDGAFKRYVKLSQNVA